MGLIANYQLVNDQELEKIMDPDLDPEELLEDLEELAEEQEVFLDIDKMWDVLHFVLTGVSSDEPPADNPLSEAIVGVISAEAVTEKDRVAEILSALKSFNIEEALDKFDMEACKEAGLYPNIWDKDDEGLADALLDEIEACYNGLVTFYTMVLEAEGNVVVTIL